MTSSWIVIDGLVNEVFEMSIIQSEIAFDLLKIDTFICEVHKKTAE